MSDTPELDQAIDARRKLAAHVPFSTTYSVIYGIVLVLLVSTPIWATLVLPPGSPYVNWAILAVVVAYAAEAVIRRRRSGVHLPRHPSAYPSARLLWMASILIAIAGLVAIQVLVANDLRPAALLALPVVAAGIFVTQFKTRTAMARDVEAGRLRP